MSSEPNPRSTNRRLPEWAAIAIAGIAAAVAIAWQKDNWRISIYPSPTTFADSAQDWLSARNFWTGRQVYGPLEESILVHMGQDKKTEHKISSAHPPASILMFLPFGQLDYQSAHCAWDLSMLILWTFSAAIVARELRWRMGAAFWLGFVAVTVSAWPVLLNSLYGQINIVVMFLIVAAWRWERHNRFGMAGASVGLAAALKLFPAFLFLYWLMQGRFKALATGLAAFAMVNGMALALFGREAFAIYFYKFLPVVNNDFLGLKDNFSVSSFWVRIFNPTGQSAFWVRALYHSPLLAICAVYLSQLLILAVTAWSCRRAGTSRQRDLAFATAITAMLLVSPLVWSHYFVFLLQPLLVLWSSRMSVARRCLLGLALFVLWAPPSWFVYIQLGPHLTPESFPLNPAISLLGFAAPTYALVLVFGLLGHTQWRDIRGTEGLAIKPRG